MKWKFTKFRHDNSIYGICPYCGFYYDASATKATTGTKYVGNQYRYCPMCGKYLYDGDEQPKVSYERCSIAEYYISWRKSERE